LKTKDGRFAYEEAGDPAMPPLVFLHGIGGAARAWRGQVEAFGDRHRAIAWDMPGYGGSAPLATVSIAALADALQEFLQANGAVKPILVGHSIGGMIVQQWLVQHPHVVPWSLHRPVRLRQADGDWRNPLSAPGSVRSTVGNHGFAALNLVRTVGDDPDASRMARANAWRAFLGDVSRHDAGAAGIDQRNALKDIKMPTLLLSLEGQCAAPMMAKMATVPSAKYVELDGRPPRQSRAPGAFNAALDHLKADVAATQVTAS
jgi:3-oxoadipate enol-lactonase